MTSPLVKVDAHHHLWRRDSPNHPVLTAPDQERYYGSTGRLKHEAGVETFMGLAAQQGVVRSVYVESHYSPVEEEAAVVQAIGDAHGFPHAIVGRVDPESATLRRDLERDRRLSRYRGVRLAVNWSADPLRRGAAREGVLRDAAWRRGYAMLAEFGLVADLLAWPEQLTDVADLARDHPDIPLVLEHTGLPADRDARGLALWREGLRRVADRPNTTLKISGLGMVDHGWTTGSIRPLVDEAIAAFGADRCMFASNWPVDSIHAAYSDIWRAFEAVTAERPEAERRALFHDTAVRVYRL